MPVASLAAYRRSTGWLGATVLYEAQTASTNDLLWRAGEAGAVEGVLALTEEQTAGRGRLGRRWTAPPGTCLLWSLLFRPPAPFAWSAARTTMLCGLALWEAVTEVAGVPVALKWPNDLIVERDDGWRKVAGMLSEVGLAGDQLAFLVVGIGLNVNVPPAALAALAPNATSLLAERGQPVDRAALLDSFLARAEARYEALRAGADPWSAWAARLAWLGQPVQVQTPTALVTGIMEGVDAEGGLQLRLPDGSLAGFPVGDVTVRKTIA